MFKYLKEGERMGGRSGQGGTSLFKSLLHICHTTVSSGKNKWYDGSL